MSVRWAIQMVEPFDNQKEAVEAEAVIRDQDGFLAARVLAPGVGKPDWRLQAFFEDEPEAEGWLPDGMRRVILPEGFQRGLGIA